MSVWQRQQCPVASTLSRFLGDINGTALEQLRTLFESDLLVHGFDQTHNGILLKNLQMLMSYRFEPVS